MSPQAASPISDVFETFIPARLDRLPWSRFHWLFVIGLGITWVLDGLEVTLMGAVAAMLQRPDVMHLSAAQIGSISSCYLGGAVLGALLFGHLTDRFGRRKFFFLSLSLYLAGVGLTACSWNLASSALFTANLGWRLGFAIGPLIGLVIIYFRRFIPESPRWLLTHGKPTEAET